MFEKLFFETYDPASIDLLQAYTDLYKQIVHFEFALNLLSGVQAGKPELLHAENLPIVKSVSHYLTLLAEREVKIDENFLYRFRSIVVNYENSRAAVRQTLEDYLR